MKIFFKSSDNEKFFNLNFEVSESPFNLLIVSITSRIINVKRKSVVCIFSFLNLEQMLSS